MAFVKKYDSEAQKKDYRQELIDRLIEKMKEAVKYQKPWFTCDELPYNRISGEAYRGSNFVTLASEGRSDPRWLTFKQIQELAEKDGVPYNVKGQKGMMIQRWIPAYDKNSDGKPESEPDQEIEPGKSSARGGWKFYAVFNGEQIENFPPFHKRDKEFENYLPAELLIESMRENGLKIEHHSEGRAYYIPSKDEVCLPKKDLFKTEGLYYRTALHEIGHATGHPSRLDRDQSGSMHAVDQASLHKYAKEELIAELSAYYVGAELGIPYSSEAHENHAAYLKSWISALEDPEKGKEYFADAIKEAGKSADLQINTYHEKVQSLEKNLNAEISNEKPIENDIPIIKDVSKVKANPVKAKQVEMMR